ncbi:MAG: sigma-70 family RNA polymerase sigma factor [Phycisphaerae bacterium]|nr:sigma-70 family RNA polymerase sigma factor [Phycisphaerae bacterium]
MSISDADLVKKVLQGDQNAFGQLYDKYARLVRAICYDTTGDVTQAQDLGQEVFLRAYNKLEVLQDHDRFSPWLVSMARNVCREFRRSKFRDKHVLMGFDTPEETTEYETVSQHDISDEVHDAMMQLDEDERMALHVYYLQGNDPKKAQEILGISRSSFYRLLEKARENLHKLLTEE